ncbi:related to Protease synthase and sporulation negative regulatory protein PAI 1 [Cephalotrichum gorgonifer]|uniref:Related to Protease synthase and sporulation negative regulatory protein PAI 1 n=1 Tax=Cephalotrichum gorgonifer TaxID=2041049 RepID=A0AAE8SY62_9PEZI|nr:related to Protease synthase and sporulation negative regulatory protein PAI 1 [Cephalotrichum gorgonifer]
MSKVTIRKAQASDAPSIAALGAHVFTVTFGHSVTSKDLESFLSQYYTPSAIADYLSPATKQTLVAVNEAGKIMGFVTLDRASSEPCVEHLENLAELARLYVDTSAHGQGVGTLLSKAVEQLARDEGYKNMWLGVWEENHKAIKAYERWGYKPVGDHSFFLGSEEQTDLIFAKAL